MHRVLAVTAESWRGDCAPRLVATGRSFCSVERLLPRLAAWFSGKAGLSVVYGIALHSARAGVSSHMERAGFSKVRTEDWLQARYAYTSGTGNERSRVPFGRAKWIEFLVSGR